MQPVRSLAEAARPAGADPDGGRPRSRAAALRPLPGGALVVVLGLAAALAACAPADPPPLQITVDDSCATAADCEDTPALAEQVRRDTQAILAGMAHARAGMGQQEDAAP